MKNILLTLIAILIIHSSNGQNTPWSTTGPIGIGTTAPSLTLNVDPQGPGGILIGNPNTGSGGFTSLMFNISAKQNGYSWIQSTQSSGSNYGILSLNQFGGNVGIGTTSPNTLLDIRNGALCIGYANLDPSLTTLNFLANTSRVLMGQNRTAGGNENDFIYNPGTYLGGFAFYNHDNNNVETQLMWIQGNGNVLIGKTSQINTTYKLDVNGNVRANQIVVNSTGADYVFAPLYSLRSLSFLKKYIDQNHHLPEIPSAKQMQADGLNVGDNQVKLLQKIEELTLYLIEQNKRIEKLESQLKAINHER